MIGSVLETHVLAEIFKLQNGTKWPMLYSDVGFTGSNILLGELSLKFYMNPS
jgi:hypothetical protein